MKTSRIIILVLLTLAISTAGCNKNDGKANSLRQVEAVKAKKETISKMIMVTGSIDAEGFAEIYPKGYGKVIKKLLKEGDPVKKDQTILIIQNDDVGFTYKPAPVTSTISGFVGRIMADVGENVGPQTPVATVVKPDKMRIKLDVPENYLPAISPGMKINFTTDSLPGQTFTASIESISKAIDTSTRTSRVELIVPNDDQKLIHGMFARVNLPVETHENAITIPNSAISWEADKQFAYKIEGNKIARVNVTTGIRYDGIIEITEGLKEGDIVVANKTLEIKDGETIKIKEEKEEDVNQQEEAE